MRKFEALFTLQGAIKNYFNNLSFLEVTTPPIVENPGMETHIHPFKVSSTFVTQKNKKLKCIFIHLQSFT